MYSVCLSVCPLRDLRKGMSYQHASFSSVKSFCQVAQTAWWASYMNAKLWMLCLPFSAVSTYDMRNHTHILLYRMHCSQHLYTMLLVKAAICLQCGERSICHSVHFQHTKTTPTMCNTGCISAGRVCKGLGMVTASQLHHYICFNFVICTLLCSGCTSGTER